jgi:hypothetical protein
MNPYTVHHATLTTTSSWDEIPFDNQLMIWRNVYEQMRVDRYRARELRFGFFGFIALAERKELWQGVQDWLNRETHPITHYQKEQQQIAQEQISRLLETRKVLYVLEFKQTSDQRRNYRERGEARARAQHDVLVKSLEKVAGEAVGENSGWKIKLLIFVGGTCGSLHVQTLNNNLRELGVLESKRNTIRRGLVHELLNAQDTVLCSYFAQRSGARGEAVGETCYGPSCRID